MYNLPHSWDDRLAATMLGLLIDMGISKLFAQAVLGPQSSRVSAFQVPGITSISHCGASFHPTIIDESFFVV
jgi:hypothetical protein